MRAAVADALAILPRFAEDIVVTIVDDGSTDRTGAIADELAAKDARVLVIHHQRRRGYGGAVRSGLVSARKDWIFYTDGDRQFDLTDLGKLLAVADGADVVVGYRAKRADPPRRLFVAWVYNGLIRLLFGGGWRESAPSIRARKTASSCSRLPRDPVLRCGRIPRFAPSISGWESGCLRP